MTITPRRSGSVVALLAMHLALAVGVVALCRTARDAMLLHVLGPEALPVVYVAAPLVGVVVTWLYALAAHRVVRSRLSTTSCVFAAMALGAFYVGGARGGSAFVYAFYLASDALGAVLILQAWSLVHEAFDIREAKRAMAYVGAGGQIGGVLFSLLASFVSGVFAIHTLIGIAAACALVAGCLLFAIPRARDDHRSKDSAPPFIECVTATFTHRHLRNLAFVSVLGGVVVQLVDYQFKADTALFAGGDAASLGVFFGRLHAACNAIGLLVQLALAPRLLQRFGPLAGALPLPLALAGGTIGGLLVPGLASATAAKAADLTLRYSLSDASMQLLYLPVQAAERAAARAVIDGVLRPSSAVLGGLLVPWLGALAEAQARSLLVAVVLVFTTLWLFSLWHGRGLYVKTLAASLDGGAGKHVEPRVTPLTRTQLVLGADHPAVVAERLESRGSAAITSALSHADAHVRAGAVVASMRGGETQVFAAAEDLRRLLDADTDEESALAAAVLGELRVPSLTPKLAELLTHPRVLVRRAAVAAVSRSGETPLVLELLPLLADDDVGNDAVRALVALPDRAPLSRAISQPRVSFTRRLRLVSALVSTDPRAALAPLEGALARRRSAWPADPGLRRAAVLGLLRLRSADPQIALDADKLRAAFDDEITVAEAMLHAVSSIGEAWQSDAARGLARCIDVEVDRSIVSCAKILALLHPDRGFEALPRAILGARHRRASAIEVIDASLQGEPRRRLLSVMEARRAAVEPQPPRTPAEWLAAVMAGPDASLSRAAMEVVRADPSARFIAPLERIATAARPDVRDLASSLLASARPRAA